MFTAEEREKKSELLGSMSGLFYSKGQEEEWQFTDTEKILMHLLKLISSGQPKSTTSYLNNIYIIICSIFSMEVRQ